MGFSMSAKRHHWNCGRNCMQSVDCFGEYCHFENSTLNLSND
jgi:hypothetical protein